MPPPHFTSPGVPPPDAATGEGCLRRTVPPGERSRTAPGNASPGLVRRRSWRKIGAGLDGKLLEIQDNILGQPLTASAMMDLAAVTRPT